MWAGSAGKPSRPGSGQNARPTGRAGRLTLEKGGDALLDGRNAVAGTVGADGAHLLQQPLGAVDDIGLVAEVADEQTLVLEQLRVLEQAADLAKEGDGLLVQLLGVANVGRDDVLEGQAAVAFGQARAKLLGLDGQLAADGVLGPPDVGVDGVNGQSHGCRLVATLGVSVAGRSGRALAFRRGGAGGVEGAPCCEIFFSLSHCRFMNHCRRLDATTDK